MTRMLKNSLKLRRSLWDPLNFGVGIRSKEDSAAAGGSDAGRATSSGRDELP